jgi:deazaflavin-dependent oxidoreductase (nitroreductase family)
MSRVVGMNLGEQLDYRFRPPNRMQRLIQSLASTRAGAWVLSRVLPRLDTLVHRLTRHRHSAPSLLAGLPVLDLTSTGRTSGRARTSHLIAVPHHDTLALIGTNFGQSSTPAWVLNLEVQPRAQVTYRGATVDVHARLADAEESAEIMAASSDYYVGYGRYQGRVSGRRVRVFVLETATA